LARGSTFSFRFHRRKEKLDNALESKGSIKDKNFLWRLAKQTLPSANLLHHRNMATMDACSLCGQQDSCRHSLIKCHTVRCVSALHLVATTEPNVKRWIFCIMDSMRYSEFIKVLVTLWTIWTAHRKAIHEGVFQSPLSTYHFVRRYTEELTSDSKDND
jgi:hypothetical protein